MFPVDCDSMAVASFPHALDDYMELPRLGEERVVFEGRLCLKADKKRVDVHGRVFYSFCERILFLFEGEILDISFGGFCGKHMQIEAGEGISGNVLITSEEVANGKSYLSGYTLQFVRKKKEEYLTWRWSYLNAPRVFGKGVVRGSGVSSDRLVFNGGEYRIILENTLKCNEGKYQRHLSHYCELTRLDAGGIVLEDALEEIRLFSTFFSFVAGCRLVPLFVVSDDNDTIECEYHVQELDENLKPVFSWKPHLKDFDLIPLWMSFRSRYNESSDNADILNTLVHWYLEANMNSGLLEGAVLMGFAGIGLLSNEIAGKELGNKGMIDDLVLRLHLEEKVDSMKISSMRNALAHYEKNHRVFYANLSREEKVQNLELLLQVFELGILFWLGYSGHYSDRLFIGYKGEDTRRVPWVDN